VGYDFFIKYQKEIEAEAALWHQKAKGRPANRYDISGALWRGLNEGERWGTLRNAWTDFWGPA
jgi:hypothetical protein